MAEQPLQLAEGCSSTNGLVTSFSRESQAVTEGMYTSMSQDMLNQPFLNQQLSPQELDELLSGPNIIPQTMMLLDTPTLPSQEPLTEAKGVNQEKPDSSVEPTPNGGLIPQEHVVSSMLQLSPHNNFQSEGSNLVLGNSMMNPIPNEQQYFENMLTSTTTRNIRTPPQNMSVPVNLAIDPSHGVPAMTAVHPNTNVHMNTVYPNGNMMNFDMCSTQVPRNHAVRMNRPAHLRHGYSKSVSMFTPMSGARPSNPYFCMNNISAVVNPHLVPTIPSEHGTPLQKQAVDNPQMLHAMRRKMGHRRQYSAPELNYSGFPRSPEKQLLRQTTEGQMLKQRGYMDRALTRQVSLSDFHGIPPEQMDSLTLQSQEGPNMKPLKILEYPSDGYGRLGSTNGPNNDSRYRDSAPFRAACVDDLSALEKSKSLDNLTREELIRRLRNVEDELAKTKGSPILKADNASTPGDAGSEQGDEGEITDSLDAGNASVLSTCISDEKIEEDEEEELDEEYVKSDKDDDKFERSQTFDCLWSDCAKSFPALDILISHIGQQHIGSGKASYKCEWQGCSRNQKPFTKRHKMYNHLRTHTGERPFQCPVADCGKRFSRPDSLATHVKTHSNVRPYLCPFPGCGKAYYHSRSLRKHVKGHELSHSYEIHPQNASGVSPSQMSDFNNQLLGATQLTQRIKYHHYQPGSSSFTTPKLGNDLSLVDKSMPASAGGRSGSPILSQTGGKSDSPCDYSMTKVDASKQQESSMLEPPVLQSHQIPDDDPMELLSSKAMASSSITTEMLDQLIRQVTPPNSQLHISHPPSEEPGLSLFLSTVRFPTQVASVVSTTQTH